MEKNHQSCEVVIDKKTNESLNNLFNMGMPFQIKLDESKISTDDHAKENYDNFFNWDRPTGMVFNVEKINTPSFNLQDQKYCWVSYANIVDSIPINPLRALTEQSICNEKDKYTVGRHTELTIKELTILPILNEYGTGVTYIKIPQFGKRHWLIIVDPSEIQKLGNIVTVFPFGAYNKAGRRVLFSQIEINPFSNKD